MDGQLDKRLAGFHSSGPFHYILSCVEIRVFFLSVFSCFFFFFFFSFFVNCGAHLSSPVFRLAAPHSIFHSLSFNYFNLLKLSYHLLLTSLNYFHLFKLSYDFLSMSNSKVSTRQHPPPLRPFAPQLLSPFTSLFSHP